MSPEQENKPQTPNDDQIADPRDLVNKPDYIADQDPEEVVDNPAVTPQMLDEFKNQRDDLKRS